MDKENYTNIDNEIKTNINNAVKTNIDSEVKIHPVFIRFVLTHPWMQKPNTYKSIREYEKRQRMKWLFENDNDSW